MVFIHVASCSGRPVIEYFVELDMGLIFLYSLPQILVVAVYARLFLFAGSVIFGRVFLCLSLGVSFGLV